MSGKRWKRIIGALALIGVAWAPGSTVAQNPFENVAKVNDSFITEYEVEQRARFLQILNASGSDRESVVNQLIEDRLRLAETRAAGIVLTEEQLEQGLAEFAGRVDLTLDAFVQGIEGEGVSLETFRDFVEVTIVWRDYVRARFGNRVQVSEEQIDRAASSVNAATGIEVLVSEIIIPAPPEQAQAAFEQAEIIAQAESVAEFSDFARQFSATASRDDGGRLDWLPISDLPPALRPVLLALGPGDVTRPLSIPDAIALFQLRDIRESDAPAPQFEAIEYAAYYINGGRSPEALQIARDIRANVDRCDDLYGIARGKPESVLDRGSLPPDEIPDDVAIELAKLDPGEVSTALTRANGNTLVFLMLCGRTPAMEEDEVVDREAVATQLRNRRLAAFSNNLLAELEAEASIVIFE